MKSKIVLSPVVIAALDAAKVDDRNILFLQGQLDRKTYEQVNFALQAIGGKWDKKVKGHVFADDPREALANILLTGFAVNSDAELDFFPTPASVAKIMVALASLQFGDYVLEPSAGDGALLRELPLDCLIDYCEVNSARLTTLKNDQEAWNLVALDFLTYNPGPIYNKIVMNPPFSKRRDLEHVLHAYECLAPGGRLVSVMAAGITFRTDKVTQKFLGNFPTHYMTTLPPDSFKLAGTSVNTVLFVADKPV